MDERFFQTEMTGSDGKPIPSQRFPTLQGAVDHLAGLPRGAMGSIWYHGGGDAAPLQILRRGKNGSLISAIGD